MLFITTLPMALFQFKHGYTLELYMTLTKVAIGSEKFDYICSEVDN